MKNERKKKKRRETKKKKHTSLCRESKDLGRKQGSREKLGSGLAMAGAEG